jgi:thiol peroxidase
MASVLFKGNPVNLEGTEIKVGDKAPAVVLPNKALADVTVGGASDCVQIIVAVPSLDTAVCAAETRRFNVEASQVSGAKVQVVSMDLPFAAGRFCTTEGIENLDVCSDFRDKEFSKAYGILIGEGALRGLCARAIFVVDKAGTVVYKELVSEVTTEPDYEAALEAAKAAGAVGSNCCGGGCH